jgi:hypothetical protein
MMDGFQISIPRRMQLARITVVVSLVLSILLSFNLWGGFRYFPLSPLISSDLITQPYDLLYPVILIVLLLASLIFRWGRILLAAAVLLSVWLVIMDASRLQPWFAVYISLLFVFVFYNGRVDDSNKFTSYFIMLQIIVAAVYFFNGVNLIFFQSAETEFTSIISPLQKITSPRQFHLFTALSPGIPYLLMFIGLGLIISPIRYLSIALCIILHVTLLIFLFPSASNLNYSLWLSNLTFLLLILLLFSGKTKQRYFSPTFLFQHPVFYLILFTFVFFPFSRFRYPGNFSSSLVFRVTNPPADEFVITGSLYMKLPLYEQVFCVQRGDRFILKQNDWLLNELHVQYISNPVISGSLLNYLQSRAYPSVKDVEYKPIWQGALLLKTEGNFIFASNSQNR